MKLRTTATILGMALALAACGSAPQTVSRNAAPEEVAAFETPPLRIASYHVSVPRSLAATEAESFFPSADIVWKGDPAGDRHQQVAAIFEDGIRRSAALMGDGRPVDVRIEVQRFHGVTDRTRYSVGGRHEVDFSLAATDAETGEVVVPAHDVSVWLKSLAGKRAIESDQKGITQKVRVTDFIARALYEELTGQEAPEGTMPVVVQTETVEAEGAL
ncbi:DUF6778 family protein [Mesobacterium pallidum]|uniref:DUF6778 family protein n=1 Tax=Mesobacterium pallidum TaxID=2872037 RepID=UPI001EE1E710|nr:DUF6778 family protein [Mesobacterium pallidum]